MAEDPYRYFRLEAREILDQFGAALLEIEKTGDATPVPRLLRLAHTLKGAARVVKQPDIANDAHAIEEELSPFRAGSGTVPRDQLDTVLHRLDAITGQVVALEASGSGAARAAATPAASERPADDAIRTVRAEIAEMDALLDGVAETHTLVNRLRATLRSVEQAHNLTDLLADQLVPGATTQSATAAARTRGLADDLRRDIGGIERQLGSAVDQIDRELRQLRAAAEQLRLVRAGTLFTALERTARDTAAALSKQIVFEARGGDIRLDADVLATMQGALVQIVRNAVAHGIESPAAREAAGKPPAGRIALDIARRGRRIVFRCSDDGAGFDLDRVRQNAVQRGVPVAEANRAGARDLIRLLLRGGISTSAAVTEIAGRGIGLDIVRETCERLGGAVEVTTDAGKGAAFELVVPVSVAAMETLSVEAAGTVAAIPLDALKSTLLLGADAISRDTAGATIVFDQQVVPFLWLPLAFGGQRVPIGRKWPTIVIAAPAGIAAIGVDRLLGTATTVVRPLPELAPAAPIIAGAALDSEGNPQLVLNPDGLIGEAHRRDLAEAEPERTRHAVLIVDDSLTTRMLERSILESAGYEVDLAESAEEGLEIARQKPYALFLVDVEMPGMDGFSFVAKTRADPQLRDTPAVLVTSRAAPEDRQRGRDAGARGYVVKGEFDQAELLATIRSLID